MLNGIFDSMIEGIGNFVGFVAGWSAAVKSAVVASIVALIVGAVCLKAISMAEEVEA